MLFIVLFVLQAHLPKVVLPFMPAAKVSIVMLWHQPWPIYFSLYFIPMFTLVFLWLGDLYQARRVVKKASLINKSEAEKLLPVKFGFISFIETKEINTPAVWGAMKPLILLPRTWRTWDKDRLERILLHELAHVHRRDWLWRQLTYFIRAVFWFLPPAWILLDRIKKNAELSADDQVIEQLSCRSAYAEDILFMVVEQKTPQQLVALDQSFLHQRLSNVLDGGRDRSGFSFRGKVVSIIGLFLLLSLLFSLHITEYQRPVLVYKAPDLTLTSFRSVENKNEKKEGELHSLDVIKRSVYEQLTVMPQSWSAVSSVDSDVVEAVLPKVGFVNQDRSLDYDLSESIEADNISIELSGFLADDMLVPRYPLKALRRSQEAEIKVIFDIDVDGLAKNIRFEEENKNHVFNKEVKKALENSRFSVRYLNGEPVRISRAREVYKFKIN
ncbi:M56 family metallopeptidase [Agaribacterium sp. ZY112]|uniref:M56 family metallopeptidase n=1 Tax=Agaribacterium sp. ZY112 TaxID=3233574 RepID=UPI003525D7D6